MTNDRYLRGIQKAAGDAPVPDAKQIVQTTPAPNIPRTKPYRFSTDGLLIQRELSDSAWLDILPEIKALHSSYQLIIGDWMLYGFEHGYALSHEDMAKLTGLQPQTIEVYTSVCRNVPQLMRVNPLRFGHYRAVSKLPDDEKPCWIQYAASNHLSTRVLQDWLALVTTLQLPAAVDNNLSQPGDPTPLPDEIEEQEVVDLPPASIKAIKKTSHKFLQCVAENRLLDMRRDDFYLYVQFVERKWAEYKRLSK